MHQALDAAPPARTRTTIRAFQIAVIEEAMSNFYRYFFIMPSLARLELEIHERVERGGAITADYLNNLMADLIGGGVRLRGRRQRRDRDRIGLDVGAVPHPPLQQLLRVPVRDRHRGRAITSSSASRPATPGAVESYLAFLRSAGSMYPLEGLRMAGVDMTSPEPVRGGVRDAGRYGRRGWRS